MTDPAPSPDRRPDLSPGRSPHAGPRRFPRRRRARQLAPLVAMIAVSSWDPDPTTEPASANGRVLLDEEFDTDLDRSTWNICHWWADQGCTIESNNELESYLPRQAPLADGQLQLTAVPEEVKASNGETYPFRSGMVTTGQPADQEPAKLAFTYGRVEAG